MVASNPSAIFRIASKGDEPYRPDRYFDIAPTGGAIDFSVSFRMTNRLRSSAPALFSASSAMPAEIEPSLITAIASPVCIPMSRPIVNPKVAEIEVERWAAPNGSKADSDRLVKPDSPPSCRRVRMRPRRPVSTLCG